MAGRDSVDTTVQKLGGENNTTTHRTLLLRRDWWKRCRFHAAGRLNPDIDTWERDPITRYPIRPRLAFSPDGRHIAYWALAKSWRIVVDSVEAEPLGYDRRAGIVFDSPPPLHTVAQRKVKDLGPYPFRISRSRVAEEDAPLTILSPDHPVLCRPNPINQKDFSGWVQERGLYFADTWDSRYLTPLSSCDSGEEALAGGLLVCRFGRGIYMYTGYSFFRQLPAGVAGAFKLLVNMINCDLVPKRQPGVKEK